CYLIEQGHHDIALLCGARTSRVEFGLLADGFRKAHEDAGSPFVRSRLWHALPQEPLAELACEVLAGPSRVSALIVDDESCEAVLNAAATLRLRVPRDVSIIMHTRHRPFILSPGRVTAYIWDNAALADRAIELLVRLIQERAYMPGRVLVPGRLVE